MEPEVRLAVFRPSLDLAHRPAVTVETSPVERARRHRRLPVDVRGRNSISPKTMSTIPSSSCPCCARGSRAHRAGAELVGELEPGQRLEAVAVSDADGGRNTRSLLSGTSGSVAGWFPIGLSVCLTSGLVTRTTDYLVQRTNPTEEGSAGSHVTQQHAQVDGAPSTARPPSWGGSRSSRPRHRARRQGRPERPRRVGHRQRGPSAAT